MKIIGYSVDPGQPLMILSWPAFILSTLLSVLGSTRIGLGPAYLMAAVGFVLLAMGGTLSVIYWRMNRDLNC